MNYDSDSISKLRTTLAVAFGSMRSSYHHQDQVFFSIFAQNDNQDYGYSDKEDYREKQEEA